MTEKIKILDQKASDNEYLHKDFHGALAYSIKYLEDEFGPQAVKEYLVQVADSYFAPLTDQLKDTGLSALENHFRQIFEKEGGQATFEYDKDVLVITVSECPAITHLLKTNMLFTERFCETTNVVNETICQHAGYKCSCRYEPGKGTCVQKFWKEK